MLARRAARALRLGRRLAVPLAGRGGRLLRRPARCRRCRGRAGWPAGSRCSSRRRRLVAVASRRRRCGGCWRPPALHGAGGADPGAAVDSGWPPPGWVFVACDVGQGDALRAARRAGHRRSRSTPAPTRCRSTAACATSASTRSPLLVLHALSTSTTSAGIAGVLRGRRGRARSSPARWPTRSAASRMVRDALAAARPRRDDPPRRARRSTVGAVRLDVLGPAVAFHGTRSDPNNSSLVLRATVARRAHPAARRRRDRGAGRAARVGRRPARGRAQGAAPRLGVLRSGVPRRRARPGRRRSASALHNDYGHPSPVLLPRWRGWACRCCAPTGTATSRWSGRPGADARWSHGHRRRARSGVGARGRGPDRPAPAARRPARVAGSSVPDARMAPCPRGPVSLDDLPDPLPPVVLLVGDEELLVDRAVGAVAAAAAARRSRRSSRPSAPAARSRAPSCTSCSGRRCSATRG